MIIDLKDLMGKTPKYISFEETINIPHSYGLSDNNVLVHVDGEFFLEKNIYLFKGRLTTNLQFKCDKCLIPVNISLDIPIEEKFSNESTNDDETFLIVGNKIDLNDALQYNIILNIPIKVICKDDCLGLCHICGVNLNEGECSCDKTHFDPRFEVLRSLFKDKEV